MFSLDGHFDGGSVCHIACLKFSARLVVPRRVNIYFFYLNKKNVQPSCVFEKKIKDMLINMLVDAYHRGRRHVAHRQCARRCTSTQCAVATNQ